MPPLLPSLTTLDEYRPLYRQENTWLPAMRAICARHNLDENSLSFAPPGSNVVFWVENNKVIKLFAPFWQGDAAREAGFLNAITGVNFNTPQVSVSDEIEGWPYLLLSRVPGTPLDELWDTMSNSDRESIASSLGHCLAKMHTLKPTPLEPARPAWEQFRQSQLTNSPARQAQLGAPASWVKEIERFLANLPPEVSHSPSLAVVNGDLNPEHLFCEPTAQGWQVTGMIDFGDARMAHPFYDLVRPGMLFQSLPNLRKTMLRTYGLPESTFTPALTRELFAYDLIHEYANIPLRLQELASNPPANLDALIELEWGF
jgi:hygromycin-B 7''-O-kinase